MEVFFGMLGVLALLLLAIGGYFAAAGGVSWFILQPALKLARQSKARTQFMLSDIVWLIVLMQIGMALVAMLPPNFRPMFVLAFVGSGLLWWCSIRIGSACRVRSAVRRGVLTVVVMPLLCVLACGWGPSAIVVIINLPFVFHYDPWYHDQIIMVRWMMAIALGALPVMWLLRRVTAWVVAQPAEAPLAEEPEAAETAAAAATAEAMGEGGE